MNKLIQKTIYTVILAMIGIACDDGLEKFPVDKPSSSTFLKTERELEMAVVGAYANLWSGYSYDMTIETILDVTSDIGWERAEAPWQELGNGKVDPNNTISREIWTNSYTGIQRCNTVLANASRIENITDQAKMDRNLAEARFLRAYWYHHLVSLYGDVPLVTTPLALSESNLPRTPKPQVYDFILSELDAAAAVLPEKYTASADIGRATKGAALALKSRVALYAGKFDVAIAAAEAVMNSGVYDLDDDYEGLFIKSKQIGSHEIIFSISYLVGLRTHRIPQGVNSRNGRGFSSKIPTQALIDSYLCIDGLPIDESPLYDPEKPFENRDPRLHYTCVVPGSVFDGFQFETHRDSVECWNYNVNPPVRVPNQDALNPFASFSGYCWRKYADMENPDYLTRSETGIVVLRFAEVLLNYAEAKIESNELDQSVYDALNAVRTRVGMPPVDLGKTQEELRSIVRIERKSELAFEGTRLYDIRRWRIAEEVMTGELLGRIPRGLLAAAPEIDENGTPNYDNVPNRSEMRVIELRIFDPAKNYVWPIPQIELEVNDLISQNPGY
ncbi:MAG TPA: RagB/SusD family nutrient uptake outer membrane protein [Cyclobacteriaceae bacterium]